jgi:hypothetical protein
MSYVFGLSFEYHRYRHDAIVRVYADDHLVDEFSLTKDIKLKTINYDNFYDDELRDKYPALKDAWENYKTFYLEIPEKLFLFEIDEKYLCNRIRIEVQNDNNNHTNGFMNKFSYLSFTDIFLLPKCLLEHNKWQNLCTRFNHDEELVEHDTQNTLFLTRTFPHRPLPHEITWRPDIIQNKNNEHWRKYILGGSFSMEIPLSRKHGVTHLGRLKPGRIAVNNLCSFILRAFNQLNMFK